MEGIGGGKEGNRPHTRPYYEIGRFARPMSDRTAHPSNANPMRIGTSTTKTPKILSVNAVPIVVASSVVLATLIFSDYGFDLFTPTTNAWRSVSVRRMTR